MSNNKRKIFPKFKKKLKGFLTDESGKISKKDALWLAAGAVLLSWAEETFAVASYTDLGTGHNNIYASPAGELRWNTITAWTSCNHASWIVNWHYSATSSLSSSNTYYKWDWGTVGVSGHSSHASHGSHGSRW